MKRPELLDGILRRSKESTGLKKQEHWTSDSEIGSEPEVDEEASSSSLEKYEDYPGWLWDPTKQEWVPDPESTEDSNGNAPEA